MRLEQWLEAREHWAGPPFDDNETATEAGTGVFARQVLHFPAGDSAFRRRVDMDLGLAGKQALITGGSKGMGRAVALELAAEGAEVMVAARGASALDQLVDQIRAAGGSAHCVAADLATAAGVDLAIGRASAVFGGGLDILVNTVGADVYIGPRLEDSTDDQWYGAVDLGLMCAVRCCRAAIPLMRARGGGRIVNVSAMSIRRQFPELAAYTATKAATASVTKNLARALAPDNILVNTLMPGIVLSDGPLDGLRAQFPGEDDDRLAAHFLQICADIGGAGRGLRPDLGRVGRPEEIAAAITFLVSERASYITGAELNVDGGTDF